MTEVVLDCFDVDTGPESGDGIGVAQVVRVQLGDPDPRADGVGGLDQDALREVVPAGAPEHQVVHQLAGLPAITRGEARGGLVLSLLTEECHGLRRQLDQAGAAVLGRRDGGLAVAGDLAADVDRGGVQVHVGPLEAAQLTGAQAGVEGEYQRAAVDVLLGRGDERRDLLAVHDVEVGAGALGELHAGRGIFLDEAGLDGRGHGRADHAVHVMDRGDRPAIGLQLGDHSADVHRRQRGQLDLPDHRRDVPVHHVGVVGHGAGCGVDLVVPQPDRQPLGDGHPRRLAPRPGVDGVHGLAEGGCARLRVLPDHGVLLAVGAGVAALPASIGALADGSHPIRCAGA